MQWAGNYLTVEGIGISKGASIYWLSVAGSTATISGITKFKGITKSVSQSWIYNHLILVPYGTRGNRVDKTKVGLWKYPAGGKPLQTVAKFANGLDFQAVTFSPSS